VVKSRRALRFNKTHRFVGRVGRNPTFAVPLVPGAAVQIGQKNQRQGEQDPAQKTEAEGIDILKPGTFGGGQA